MKNKILILYLRAARHFNKGRYSRNRQLYRTGVYWCIWLNVVIVYALHYYFYRVIFAFGYLWLPLGIMVLSIFSSRLYKYRYYSVSQLLIEFKEYSNWLLFFMFNILTSLTQLCTHLCQYFGTLYKSYKTILKLSIDTFSLKLYNLFN